MRGRRALGRFRHSSQEQCLGAVHPGLFAFAILARSKTPETLLLISRARSRDLNGMHGSDDLPRVDFEWRGRCEGAAVDEALLRTRFGAQDTRLKRPRGAYAGSEREANSRRRRHLHFNLRYRTVKQKENSFWNSRHPACSFPHGILPEMNVPKTVFFLFYDS